MATIVANLTTLHDADALGTTIGNKPVLDPSTKVQGSNSIDFTVTATNRYSGLGFTATNLTDRHIRMWYTSTISAALAVKASGGIAFFVRDGSGNESYWYVDGSDTYQGGWRNYCVYLNYTDNAPDANNGTNAVLTNLVGAGILINNTGSIRNAINTWVDYLRYGEGLKAYGSTAFGMEEIWVDDVANGYGIVEKVEGVYFLSGSIELGDSAGVNICNYVDSGETIVFTDKLVAPTLYKVIGVGNATGATDVIFTNCAIKSSGPLFDIDMDDASVESFELNGCVIQGADEVLLAANCTITGSTFNACGLITVGPSVFEDSTVSNPTGSVALLYPAAIADDNTARITFITGTYAIQITADVDHTFNGHKFSGTWTAHVYNTSGQAIIVYATNGSNASTFTGTVDIQNSVTVTLVNIKEGSEVIVLRTGTQTQEDYIASVPASGEFAYTFNSPPSGFTAVDIFIILPGYVWYPIYNYILPTSSASLPVTQQTDRNYIT
jgi:hypothetical protein